MKKKKKYTVILAYPHDSSYDSTQTWMGWTWAASPSGAVDAARKQVVRTGGCGEWGDPPGSDLETVCVLEGWQKDVQP